MSNTSRGMTVAQALALANDPSTSQAILVQLANRYPETWQALLAHPNMYGDLREWIQRAEAEAEAVAQQKSPVAEQDARQDPIAPNRTAPNRTAPNRTAPNRSEQITEPKVTRSVARKKTRRRGPVTRTLLTLIPAVVIIAVVITAVASAFALIPAPGTITTENIVHAPEAAPAWNYSLVADDDPNDCLYYDVKTYDQNVAIVLSQNDLSDADCRDAENPPADTLALIDTQSGKEFWKIDLADELPWSSEWKKEIVSTPGLNVILVKFIDINSDDTDKNKTLVPFNRLNGTVTDAFIAANKNDAPPSTPFLEVVQIPNNSRDVLVMTGGTDKEFRYSYFRAKKLSQAEWKYESDLKPLGSMPIVGNALVLGRYAADNPVAISLTQGTVQPWFGAPAGKIYNVNGTYIQVQGDSPYARSHNRDSFAGGEDLTQPDNSDTFGPDDEEEPKDPPVDLSLTAITPQGVTLWTKKVPGYAVTKSSTVTDNATRAQVSQLLIAAADHASLMKIDPLTGEELWSYQPPSASFEIPAVSGGHEFFILNTDEGAEEPSTESVLSTASGTLQGTVDILNANSRVDGVAKTVGYLIDEPKRTEVEDDEDATVQSVQRDDDDPEEMKKVRVCVTAFSLATAQTLWTLDCNGYQHVGLAGGNVVMIDKTPGEQAIRAIRSK